MTFQELEIPGVYLAEVSRFQDERGWLVETFRQDILEEIGLKDAIPVMSYISLTHPGIARGPHEHLDQTDTFAFLGPSTFRVVLWDNRPNSRAKGKRLTLVLGEERPAILVVPPGVVHAYQNIGPIEGLVLNYPNRLYGGWGKKEAVDEVRHENDPGCPFRLEDMA
jgi:dTDP-4-dehydrorhamnose 3,5-epimerase